MVLGSDLHSALEGFGSEIKPPAPESLGVRVARLKREISERDVQIALLKSEKVELRSQLSALIAKE